MASIPWFRSSSTGTTEGMSIRFTRRFAGSLRSHVTMCLASWSDILGIRPRSLCRGVIPFFFYVINCFWLKPFFSLMCLSEWPSSRAVQILCLSISVVCRLSVTDVAWLCVDFLELSDFEQSKRRPTCSSANSKDSVERTWLKLISVFCGGQSIWGGCNLLSVRRK